MGIEGFSTYRKPESTSTHDTGELEHVAEELAKRNRALQENVPIDIYEHGDFVALEPEKAKILRDTINTVIPEKE